MYAWITNHLEFSAVIFALVMLVFGVAIPIVSQLKVGRHPKAKRHPAYGREFLMLLDKDVGKKCWEKIRGFTVPLLTIFVATMFLTLILLFVVKTNYERWTYQGALLACGLSLWALLLPAALQSRKHVLLPAYRQRELEKTKAAFNAAVCEFNGALPTRGYRVDIPEASPDSLPRLRVMAKEKRLPAELTAIIERLAQARAELDAAEQECAAPQAATESKAQTP